jgi:E3 ubiquitin-protein ligase HERC2
MLSSFWPQDGCFSLPFRNREEPVLITGLLGKQVIKICCGSSYSVALTANGEVYSWGKGNFGRLGHGSSEDQSMPILLKFFKGHRIMDIACGSGDAQTLAVTDTGIKLISVMSLCLSVIYPV